jgi:hypothetical protein
MSTLKDFAALTTGVEDETHVNIFGGTVRPWGCHDCVEVADSFMVHDDLWCQAFARSPARESQIDECFAALREHLGRDVSRDDRRRVKAHFGVVLCLWCFAKRIDRHLRIPADLKLDSDGKTLPINRPLVYAYTLGEGAGIRKYESWLAADRDSAASRTSYAEKPAGEGGS